VAHLETLGEDGHLALECRDDSRAERAASSDLVLDELTEPIGLEIEVNVGIRILRPECIEDAPQIRAECFQEAGKIQCQWRETVRAAGLAFIAFGFVARAAFRSH
jgi:hypothetical protein